MIWNVPSSMTASWAVNPPGSSVRVNTASSAASEKARATTVRTSSNTRSLRKVSWRGRERENSIR